MKWVKLPLALILSATLAAFAGGPNDDAGLQPPPGSYENTAFQFHSVVPLGMESLELEPAHKLLNLLASATSPGFEGMERKPSGGHIVLLDPRGKPVRYFPRQIDFRVSITSDGQTLDPDPVSVKTQMDPGELMLGLRFRLKVFHGLDSFFLEPEAVDQIGEPADVPASERIYLAHFALPTLPATDRILLEVLDPSGERITRFHLELL